MLKEPGRRRCWRRSRRAGARSSPRKRSRRAAATLDKAEAGSGPYMIDEWIPNQTLKLKRNPNYYDKDRRILDGVTFQVIPEESAIIAQLRSGNVHLAP